MAVWDETENKPAGYQFRPGDLPELDQFIASGQAGSEGYAIDANGGYINASTGKPITSKGGTTKTVNLSNATAEELQAIKNAADLKYLAQNTGVSTAKMKEAYASLGIDPDAVNAHSELDKVLKAAGYNPGEQKTFYGNTDGPADVGAKILSDRWQVAPTDADLIAAGYDPDEYNVINSNAANALYLKEQLSKQNIARDNTLAYLGEFGVGRSLSEVRQFWEEQGVADEPNLDMFEWDLIKKKKPLTGMDVVGGGAGGTGTVNIGGGGTGLPPNLTGGDTGGGYGGPGFTSTPNIGTPGTIYPEGFTGLSEVAIPTFEDNINRQVESFREREAESAKLYKPQTLAEQQAAGTAPTFENVLYRNRFGMSMYIQHINGVPSQPIPPGYYRVQGFGIGEQQTQAVNQGGMIKGFNPGGTVNPALNYKPGGTVVEEGGKFRIKYPDGTYSQYYDTALNAKSANDMGLANLGLPDYTTYLSDQGININLPGYDEAAYQAAYQSYITDPTTLQNIQDQQAAADAASQPPETAGINQEVPMGQMEVTVDDLGQAQRDLVAQATVAPGGAVAASPTAYIDPNAYGTVMESTAGQALATAPVITGDQIAQIETATVADTPVGQGAATYDANQAYSDVQQATEGMTPVTSTGPSQTITAEEQKTTSVSDLDAASGESVDVSGAPTRGLESIGGQSELITGTGVDQSKVMEVFGEGELQAASVQDELTGLMQQFEGGNTPPWAAGAMRKAMASLAQRGLSASSMAGQAIVQAAMESALPIAQIDAGNKQQVALFKAEQRAKFLQMDFDQAFQAKVMNAAKISEIANMNFNAQQQIALENSKAANTMELQNLSNEQALIMAEAAALSQLDMQNLNNRQQAAVQNAQNFLQIDMANLNNAQQTAMFKQQSLISTILSDQAAANAAAQFNATSENQTNQFFSNLAASVNQFNAAQVNAMKQFNADEANAVLEFNSTLQNQREMFNAQNYLVVAQANAQWRQNLATINTAAANETNMDYAQTVNALTLKTLDEIWQRERDIMDYSFTQSENAADRALSILLGDKQLSSIREQLEAEEDMALGQLLTKIFFSSDTKSIFGG